MKTLNFKQWVKMYYNNNLSIEGYACAYRAWDACVEQVLKILEDNKELEATSSHGVKRYKIGGSVIDKIRKL